MSQPILTVDGPGRADQPRASVNLLPCRIHHDGEVGAVDTYWSPALSKDGTQNIAYVRGRKLYGKTVKVPEGYYGAVASRQDGDDDEMSRQRSRAHEDEVMDIDGEVAEEPATKLGALRSQGVFDEFVVWGHESVADASADTYVRGIEEWVGFAEKIHAYPAVSKEPSS
ncbi:ribonuclease H1/H2 small subunit [Microdochium bolleyi]|uniref:Ribonuclease H1/H2 small subunit n=1 Tax=Microdochium bolleyi TaxID=196109 RepID=A0A136JEW3_9PEZI|nr:ribonuclease H1/H2 small subunit [Microdochium bolleyi]